MPTTDRLPFYLRLQFIWAFYITLCYALGLAAAQREFLLYGFVSQLFLTGLQVSNAFSEWLVHGRQLRTVYAFGMSVYMLLAIGHFLAFNYAIDQLYYLLPAAIQHWLPLLTSLLAAWYGITLLLMPLVLSVGYGYVSWLATQGHDPYSRSAREDAYRTRDEFFRKF